VSRLTRCQHEWAGVDSLADFPNVDRWLERWLERPAVKRGLQIPEEDTIDAMHVRCQLGCRVADRFQRDPSVAEKHASGYSKWVLSGSGQLDD